MKEETMTEQELDAIAVADRVRQEHEATHGEAEMCGAECIALGLVEFEETMSESQNRRTAIAADRTWASGYAAGRAAGLREDSPSVEALAAALTDALPDALMAADEMTDRGAAALAERLHEEVVGCMLGHDYGPEMMGDHRADARAILGEHGVFLPDGREVLRLRAIERAARDILDIGDCRCVDGYTAHGLHAPDCLNFDFMDLRAALATEPPERRG